MYKLVYEKRNDVFTNSLIIANETKYNHHTITRKIRDYEKDFLEFGKVGYHNQPLESGQKQKIYLLNEMQATYLITLLENNDVVRAFKLALVKEFYRMRQALIERQTTDWLQTRKKGKLIRREETDVIKLLIPYAKEQGSKNAEQFYVNYSRLVNKAVGLESGQRDVANHKTLMLVALIEDIISHTIEEEMEKGTYYKNIYKLCKTKIQSFVNLVYLQVS